MRKLLILISVLNVTNIFSQTNKNVLGTFAAGCKVFNYDFRKTPNGLYYFKIEDIDKNGNKIFFDADSISLIKNNLKKIIDSITTLGGIVETPDILSGSKRDSILSTILKYQNILDKISLDSSDLKFWKENKDSIRIILKAAENIRLDSYDSSLIDFNLKPALKSFNKQLELIANTISDIANSKEYTLNDFKQETFIPLCKYILNKRKILFLPECSADTSSNNIALSIFYQIKAKLEFKDDEPVTAYLKLKNQKINCYYRKTSRLRDTDSDATIIQNKFIVDNVSVEFEDGTIKNIYADLNMEDSAGNPSFILPIRFKNTIPITISSRNDKDVFSSYNIYVSDFGSVKNKIKIDKVETKSNKYLKLTSLTSNYLSKFFDSTLEEINNSFEKITRTLNDKKIDLDNVYFILSDLIDYVDVLETNKEDYSPVNSVVNLNKNNPVQELRKEKRSRIITVKTFTDFVGINDDQPNGLIQIEASRKFNLRTKRNGLKSVYAGLFTYIEPKLIFSKIEKNNRYLPFSSSDLDQFELSNNKKVFNSNAINILKYQNSAFDVDLNFFKINFPNMKSNFQVNMSSGMLRTGVSDTISVIGSLAKRAEVANNKILNTFRWGITVLYELKPDNRYGLTLGYDIRRYSLLSRDYNLDLSENNVVNSIWADAYLKTNDENMLFFRYKVSFVSPASKENFVQIQLGYLLDLFKTSAK